MDRGPLQQRWFDSELSSSSIRQLEKLVSNMDLNSYRSGVMPTMESDTTYFYVVDSRGNAASCIQSLSLAFGSGVSVPGLGLIFNSRLVRGYGTPSANRLLPRTRPVNTIFPVLCTKDNAVTLIGGTAGGDLQVQLNARAMAHYDQNGTLAGWPAGRERWKYSPVSDVFDRCVGPPKIEFEAKLDEAWESGLRSAGIIAGQKDDVGGSLKYAFVDRGTGLPSWIDEGRDFGTTVAL